MRVKVVSDIPSCNITKILPLVYDESLSYYEVLCKLIEKMNEIIEAINDHFEEYLREILDRIFIECMYEAETETLILRLKVRE